MGASFPRPFGLFGQSARFSRARKSASAHLFRALADIASMVTPFNVAVYLSGQAHLARPAGGRAPLGGVGGGKGELFVPHMTLRRPLRHNIDGYYGYTSHPFTSPLPAVIHVVGLIRA